MEPKRGNLVIILGPTGVGKSRTAVSLAQIFSGEIINADSIQVYKGFDIGTDKPGFEIRRLVPHHLIDSVDPTVQFTAAAFMREAVKAAEDIISRGRLPFIVGGTGLYIKALVDGLFPGSGRDPEIRTALEAEGEDQGLQGLFEKLTAVDPEYAAKIRSRDRVRIIRALEVYYSTGKPLSEHFVNTKSPILGYHVLKIGLQLERPGLYLRIENRVDRMFEGGLVNEVQGLLDQGIPPGAPAFRALGYRHVLKLLSGEISLDRAKDLTKLDTRRYAKRQMTWFRKMEDVAWFSPVDRKALEDHLLNQIK